LQQIKRNNQNQKKSTNTKIFKPLLIKYNKNMQPSIETRTYKGKTKNRQENPSYYPKRDNIFHENLQTPDMLQTSQPPTRFSHIFHGSRPEIRFNRTFPKQKILKLSKLASL